MNARPTYYEPSGAVGPLGLLAVALFGPPVAWALGLVYAYLIYYIPFVYLNFLATVGLGLVMGLVALGCVRWGHVRNALVGAAIGALLGGLAVWFQWSRWMALFSEGAVDTYGLGLLWANIQIVASEGAWSIFSFTPMGAGLYIIWGIEAAIVVGIPAFLGLGATREPYCEECKVWLRSTSTIGPFVPLVAPSVFVDDLLRRVPDTLRQLQPSALGAMRYSELELLNCPECRRFHLMTLTTVTITHDEDGKESRDEDVEVDGLVLPADVYGALWNHARRPVSASTLSAHLPG